MLKWSLGFTGMSRERPRHRPELHSEHSRKLGPGPMSSEHVAKLGPGGGEDCPLVQGGGSPLEQGWARGSPVAVSASAHRLRLL